MKVVYAPEGEERREWLFKPLQLLSFEVEAIEDVGGESWENFAEFCQRLAESKAKPARAALWIMLRREKPQLRFPELVVKYGELWIELDDEEIEAAREFAKSEDASEEDRAEILRILGDGEAGKDEGSTDS